MPRFSRPDYNRKLSRALMLVDGRRLVTMRAAELVISELKDLPSPPAGGDLAQVAALLLVAVQSGTPEHVAAFTDEIERILLDRGLLR